MSGSATTSNPRVTSTPAHLEPIEADDSETDSAFATDVTNSSTTSISSSVLSYQYENGRRYQAYREGYKLPNDEIEQDRLDLYHHIFRLLLGGKLYAAPLDNPQRILDIGTGTGLWAIDMADEFEQAEVIGNDLSPIQPSWIPPNARFEVDDVEQLWTYDRNSFDFIHMRTLSGSIKDWPALLAQCFDHLRPGGYVEFQDYGAELFHNSGTTPNSSFAKLFNEVREWAQSIGRPFDMAKHMKAWMVEAGFVDVVVHKELWPLGPWPKDRKLKERGRWALLGQLDSLETFGMAILHRMKGWKKEDVTTLCSNARNELVSKDNRYFMEGWFVYGRKPEEGTSKK